MSVGPSGAENVEGEGRKGGSDRPILLTVTDIYRYRYIGIGILISVLVYWYRLEKI